MSSPPAKRPRTENTPITRENGSITRSDIWYKDGSVVLQAHHTQFRVHWGVLSQHSSFFREMEDLPQPPSQPSVDGCAVIDLPDDVADVEHLLRALYNLKIVFQPVLSLPIVAALIRLGRKYDFRDLLDSAVERITFENPKTLDEYDVLLNAGGKYAPKRLLLYPGILFDIIILAREQNILSALPVAYYRAASCGLDKLLNGIPREDGTPVFLPPVDLHRCIQGREKLINAQYKKDYTCGWLRDWDGTMCVGPPEQCTTTAKRV